MVQVDTESTATAEAEFGDVMEMMKPYTEPLMDLFTGIIFHEPYVVCLGGRKEGRNCVYDDWKPEITAVTTHKKPNVYNFGTSAKKAQPGGGAGGMMAAGGSLMGMAGQGKLPF